MSQFPSMLVADGPFDYLFFFSPLTGFAELILDDDGM